MKTRWIRKGTRPTTIFFFLFIKLLNYNLYIKKKNYLLQRNINPKKITLIKLKFS